MSSGQPIAKDDAASPASILARAMRCEPDGERWISLQAYGAALGRDAARLPRAVRLILEAALVGCARGVVGPEAPAAILGGDAAGTDWRFPIARLVMQDASGLPLLADLAAMRDAVADRGGDAAGVQPKLPMALVVDHSVQIDHAGTTDALARNMALELDRNVERYGFVKWAAQAFDGLTVVSPGNGIIHQLHIEHLAEIVVSRDGWTVTDSVIGTDSHTTMINGLGVLGWGVGGIEAEAALLGEPQSLPVPEIVAVELQGRRLPGVSAVDIALALTRRLRSENVVGALLEFIGPGVAQLAVEDRCTIANMAPEFGATLALFPPSAAVLDALAAFGRDPAALARARRHLDRQGLLDCPDPPPDVYARTIRLDLSTVLPGVAGPNRPDQLLSLSDLAARFKPPRQPLDGRIGLAAITSCTSTGNAEAMVTAGLLARAAVARGLRIDPAIKTTMALGSRTVADRLDALGLREPLARLGFTVDAFGCAVCVGNSGPLKAAFVARLDRAAGDPVAILSGNRNFEGRIHPRLRSAFLMSPALVVAFALAGRVDLDLHRDPVGTDAAGRAVFLADLWPEPAAIRQALAAIAATPAAALAHSTGWRRLPAPTGARFPWAAGSTYFVPPPFFARAVGDRLRQVRGARPLLVLGDGITTDHISPVGPIAPGSAAAVYLAALGETADAFNTYAARRANHDVMIRGTFANPRLRNRLVDGIEGPVTRLVPDGRTVGIGEAAAAYAADGRDAVIIAGTDYGSGSARDWAAKGTALLGVRAVIAQSFERIHRGNLVRMGVLPIEIDDGGALADRVAAARAVSIDIRLRPATARPRGRCTIVARIDGEVRRVAGRLRADTADELAYLRAGDLFAYLLRQLDEVLPR